MSPLACAAIAPHQTCPPEGNLGDSQIVFSVFGSIFFSQPKGYCHHIPSIINMDRYF